MYDGDGDSVYMEFVSDWKGAPGFSNMALVRIDGDDLEAHFYFSEQDQLQVIEITAASRWLPNDVINGAEPFEPFSRPS